MLTHPPTMAVWGLTGGIGSGKSEVARVLRGHGLPVIQADEVARGQLRRGSPVFDAVAGAFGNGILGADGEVDRAALARAAFADAASLARLNALTHPPVFAEVSRRLAVLAEGGHPVAVVEAALVFESGMDAGLDGVIVVTAPVEARVARVAARDGMPADAVRARVAAQWPDEERVRRATRVLVNDGNLESLRAAARVLALELAVARG